eukprot:1390495-Amphidinium_carterae.1
MMWARKIDALRCEIVIILSVCCGVDGQVVDWRRSVLHVPQAQPALPSRMGANPIEQIGTSGETSNHRPL